MDTNSVKIPTWTEPEVLRELATAACFADYAVELGTYMGASARTMLRANPKMHLWCVDKWQVFGTKEITEMFLAEFIAKGRCELIEGDSSKAAEMLQHMRGNLDLVFVDDGHEEWQVEADINNFRPLLKYGGVLCGHDFDVPHNDVARGVIRTGIKYTLPVPRFWWHQTNMV